jgi:Rap1a immunity proteins
MRTTVLAVAAMLALWPLHAGAQDAGVADLGDFEVDTAQDLVDLCSADPGNSLHAEALQFCYGFFEGMIHYHDRLVGPEIQPIVCAPAGVTRQDVVDMYIDFAQANPQFMDEDPADNVMRSAMAEWPCS